MLNQLLNKIDTLCLKWLGRHYSIRPSQVKLIKNEIVIVSTESNRRFPKHETLKDFMVNSPHINQADRKKLGIAVGKAIANDLIIEFDAKPNNIE